MSTASSHEQDTKHEVVMLDNVADAEAGAENKVPYAVGQHSLVPVGGLPMSEEEKKLNRRVNLKMDIFILPVLTFLYLFSGLDRGNIGNAATVDFAKDVGIPKSAVNTAVTMVFTTFVIFQPISTAFGRYVGVSWWIPIMMFIWGIFATVHAWIKNEAMLIVFRLFLGAFEAGFYPCCAYFLSTCYVRFDMAFRLSIFWGTYTIGSAFSGLIAYGLLQLGGSLKNWQWLFVVEGSMTMIVALFGLLYLPKRSSSAWFLTYEERQWVAERMRRDSGGEDNEAKGISWADVKEVLKDWKLWLVYPANVFSGVQQQAFGVFLPLIVQQLGYESYRANLYAVPIYVVGTCGLWIFAFSSDHHQERSKHILFAILFIILGLVLSANLTGPKARYAALCITQIGNYAISPCLVAWLANNTPTPAQRALVIACNGMGNLSGVIGAELFLPKYAPSYKVPFYVSLGFVIYAWFNFLAYRQLLVHVNKKRAAKLATMTLEEIEEENQNNRRIGDKKITFVYNL